MSLVVFLLGSLSFFTISSGRDINDNCVKPLYEEFVCAKYNCHEILNWNSFEIQKEIKGLHFVEEGSQICTFVMSEDIKNEQAEERQFRKWFIQRGSKTSYFQTLDKKLSRNQYCYEGMAAYSNETSSRATDLCTTKIYKPNPYIRHFQQTSTFVSPIFIFIPIIIFMLTHEIQNVHGWTHFTNGCCVFALYVSWGLKYLFFRDPLVGRKSCVIFAATQHYLHLSVFSWLVVACHDLQKLAEKQPSAKSLDTKKQIVIYTKLAIFGWGIPAGYIGFLKVMGVIFTSFGMDRESYLASIILPEYGRYRCFLAFNAYWLHLLVPTFILFVTANFYNWKTLRVILLHSKNNLSMEHALQKINVARNMACLRAMFLTTVCWGVDVVRTFMTAYDRSSLLWLRVIFDTIIVYQTIPICIIYSCRPHILNHLEVKYPALSCAIEASRTYLHVQRKEVEPDVVTQLRVNRKSDGDLVELQERTFHLASTHS